MWQFNSIERNGYDLVDSYSQCQNPKKKTVNSHLEHLCELDLESENTNVRFAGIICTIGPSSCEVPILMKMIKSGMNIARLNFSHGTYEFHANCIRNIREAFSNLIKESYHGGPIAIALDTKGPGIRLGSFKNGEIYLTKGNTIKLTADKNYRNKCDTNILYVDYPDIVNLVENGSKIYLNDGLILLIVKSKSKDSIECEIEYGGYCSNNKGVNIPGVKLDLPAVSDRDRLDFEFAIEHQVDMIFASFTRDSQSVKQIRKALGEKGKHILIVSKIENDQGLKNFDEILAESDGIMISRGDLGIEIPIQKVFLAQKMMICKSNKAGKPIICSTQMLESMTNKPRPTRAEVSDVANAVLDGADCLMLSGETAIGDYPIECVKMMHVIAKEAETAVFHKDLFMSLKYLNSDVKTHMNSIAISAVGASFNSNASAIIVLTASGYSAQLISKYRPRCPIIAITRNEIAARQMNLWHGIFPLYYQDEFNNPIQNTFVYGENWTQNVEKRIKFGLKFLNKNGFIKKGDNVVLVTGWREGSGSTNTLRIVKY